MSTATLNPSLDSQGSAMREIAANRPLLRLLGAFAALNVSEWAFVTALSIHAFRVGGTLAVGLVGSRFLVGALSSAVLAPLVESRARVLTRVAQLRLLLLGLGAAGVLAGVGLPVVLVVVAIDAAVGACYRPAQSRALPALARAPGEVSAAAAGVSMVKTLGQGTGALVGGLAAALVSPGAVMAGAAVGMAGAALLSYGLDPRSSPLARVLGDLKVGVAAIPQVLADGDAAPLVIASGLRTLVRGLWTALLVVVALRLFALGSSGVGWLNAAAGIGAAIALPITVSLIGRPRLGGPCAAAFIAAGACLIVVGAVPIAVVAAVVICVWGVAMAVADATSLSLLHRLLDPSTLSRTVGVMEALKLAAEGLGALLAPALVGLVGVRPALVIAGLPLPLTIAVSATRLRRADSAAAGRAGVVALLHRVSVLHSLDMASLEDVAARARKVAFAPGTDVVTQGEPGDDFYVIEEGEAEVLLDGYRIGRLGPGLGFGERALLRATTRSATVRTLTPLTAYAIDAVSFLSAVTGHPPSALADMREPVLGGGLEPASRPLWEVLADVTLLRGLDREQLAAVAHASAIEDWEPGEVIVQEGDDATAMYVVLSGRASTTIDGGYVRDLLPGDWFGEIAILHGVPRTATISAAERLRTCRVPADVVLAVAPRDEL